MDTGDAGGGSGELERKARESREDIEEMAAATGGDRESGREEKRKRYYSPNEVMKRKGCIGCGGAGVLVALSALALLVVLL